MRRRTSYLLLLFFFLCGKVFAQPDARGFGTKKDTAAATGNTYAIIIGISDYKAVRDLQYAHKDAEAFESFLLTNAGGNVPKNNIETFINENANRNNVGDAISVVARKAKSGDRVYFFFAGHGDMEDLTQIENGLLLLYNSPNGNYFGMNDDVLEILDLKRYLSPLSQKGVEMIFIVDACHSGNLTGGVEGAKQTGTALMSSWGKEYKILSCQPDQLSLESAEYGGGRGLFSLELEEGIKGLADADNNGKITMFELQTYIQANVAKYSEYKQIPMVSGDLSKAFFKVDPAVLAALKKQKAASYPILASANTKGNEEVYVDSLDPAGKKIYYSFIKNLADKKLISPKDTNAIKDYRIFEKKYKNYPLITSMRRNLATGLNERFNEIVDPLLKGTIAYSTREECAFAAVELDSCMRLLGPQHYMYTNLRARKLFMDAMALTWAMSDAEFNISLKPTIEKAIKLLEESAKLEPNAAYTPQQLGYLYCYLFDYEKASPQFQKYLDLRPNDFYSKYSLAYIYTSLDQYEKAEELYLQLIKTNPDDAGLYQSLSDAYINDNKKEEAMKYAHFIVDSMHNKFEGYFTIGVNYSHLKNIDSAVHYYKLAASEKENCSACYNNMGHIFFLNNKIDSAQYYFQLALSSDSTYPYSNFNIGTIDFINNNSYAAINRFITGISYSMTFDECFNSNMQLYFKKKFTVTDQKLYEEYKKKDYVFNFQYFSYLSIFYCFLRDEELKGKTDKIELIFSHMLEYKKHDALSWYHYACYKALNSDKKAALQSIERSLKLGFGTYFLLTSDNDLDFIRKTPEFAALLKKYFPAETRK